MAAKPLTYPLPLAARITAELEKLPPESLAKLRFNWELWQLPHQVPPTDWEWDTFLHVGGRGSGKTTGVSQEIRKAVCDEGVKRINLVGRTAANVRDDMINGEAGLLAAFPPDQRPEYISSQSLVRFQTGAIALMLTAEEPKAIQGKNAEITWCDEFSTYGEKAEEVWRQVCLSTRVKTIREPRKYITTNSLPENAFLQRLIDEADYRKIAIRRSTSFDNFANLPAAYQRQVDEMMHTAYGRAWVLGEKYAPEGALWKEEWLRWIPEAPHGPEASTVVAVDPAGSEFGDETGIIVAKRVGKFGYVLEDLSGHYDAEVWPRMVVDAARKHRAFVVIETNRGLGFLKALIAPIDRSIRLQEITTTKKKDDRALPIAALYELGRIFHCGKHVRLEQQMLNWDPKSQEAMRSRRKATSPDRLDALVHAIAALKLHVGLVPRAPAKLDFSLPEPTL